MTEAAARKGPRLAQPTGNFNTSTVPANKTVVDAPLKPTAELHILVGGPYTINGEEHRYGHTALRVKKNGSDITYDFGRYGATSGAFGESGEGILRVWTAFNTYIRGENATGRRTTGFVYAIFDHDADKVNAYFDGLIAAGQHLANKDRAGLKVYKLRTDYDALGPNCTTVSLDGAKQAIPGIESNASAYIKPEAVLTAKERFALNVRTFGGARRMFLPANLQTYLAEGAPTRSTRVDTYGGGQ